MKKQITLAASIGALICVILAVVASPRPAHAADPVKDPRGQRLEELDAQRDSINLALAGLMARRDAIEDSVRELSERSKQEIDSDPIGQKLKAIADNLIAATERMRVGHANGTASMEAVENADNAAAQAQVKLLERREAVAAAVGGGALPRLNQELIDVSIDIAEKRAMLDFLKDAQNRAAHEMQTRNPTAHETTQPAVPGGN